MFLVRHCNFFKSNPISFYISIIIFIVILGYALWWWFRYTGALFMHKWLDSNKTRVYVECLYYYTVNNAEQVVSVSDDSDQVHC